MGMFGKNKKSTTSAYKENEAQSFSKRLLGILSGKSSSAWRGQESHWELIFGFCFFFGGLYFLFYFLSGI